MRLLLFILIASIGGLIPACTGHEAKGETDAASGSAITVPDIRQPVLVELFTSEGCSSCPPADRNLAFLESQQPVAKAEIITLAFHVDYWDRLGWKDRFSSPLYSRRQEIYSQVFKLNSNYTPQMVVDGRAEFVGSDSGRASKEVQNAVDSAKARIEISAQEGRLTVKVVGVPRHMDATVYAAIAEDGIRTRVERGENSGKTLEHVSVVRELKTLGMLPADKNEFDAAADLPTPADSKPDNLKVVVFVQENQGRKIIGVGKTRLKTDESL
ncbi:MAG TPA: DUF1223 domain-containing protein [Pyrinomonadaceae bacterium]